MEWRHGIRCAKVEKKSMQTIKIWYASNLETFDEASNTAVQRKDDPE